MTPQRPERLSEEAALRAIVEGVEAETGENFFRSLVQHLAAALGTRFAFVSELAPDGASFRTRAVWGNGHLLDNLVFAVEGSPCAAVLGGEMSHHGERLRELFPTDRALDDWCAESYCGVPLLDASGKVVGHLAILDDRPMPDGPRGIAIMRIFAARARAEIERQDTEAALRESEARYRDFYDEAPVAYAIIGTDARIRYVNRRCSELFGVPDAVMIGRECFDFSPDTTQGKAKVQKLYERFLSGDETDDEEIEGRRGDGATIWIRVSFRVVRDAEGNIEAARVALVDMTERKRAQEALRVSEERLARVLDSAMDAIVTFDGERRIELFNDAAEKVFGCAVAQAIGSSFDRFLTEDLRAALEVSMASAPGRRASPYLWAPEGLRARRANGAEFAIEATLSRVEVGGRSLFTLILRDVEERGRLEEERRQLSSHKEYLEEEIKSVYNFEEIVGQSRAIGEVLKQVGLVAETDSSVLVLGETGTGKELIARALHSNSHRREHPLIKVNCAALPSGLIESELFGHEKGAFTGATERRIGRFELAHRGTIFLDEIGEVPPEVQVKLLRVLQEQEIERIGGSVTIRVDVRVIAATNRDLERMVAEGTFRRDLYYRLNVFPVRLPPLRERPEDIPPLVHYFVQRYAAKIGRKIREIPAGAMARLAAYSWPGNVRELENVIERAVILSPGAALNLPTDILQAPAAPPEANGEEGAVSDEARSLQEIERDHILSVLASTNWRVDGPRGAAKVLKLNPSTLRSRMQKLGIRRGGGSSAGL